MDGVLADFAAAYYACEAQLFGPATAPSRAGDPESQPTTDGAADADPVRNLGGMRPVPHPSALRRRRDVVWQAIEETLDFWTTLKPMEAGTVARIHALALQHRWEVFFITQRPATRGDTV